jgi:hypothetical protein
MGLAAVGHHKVIGNLTAGHLFKASDVVGVKLRKLLEPQKKERSIADDSLLISADHHG